MEAVLPTMEWVLSQGLYPRRIHAGCATTLHLSKSPLFDFTAFLSTAHANQNQNPGKYFRSGRRTDRGRRKPPFLTLDKQFLYSNRIKQTIVTKNERIEECSVCHSYALQYPQFQKKISQNNMPNPQVSCGACHDSHIVAPNGKQLATVNGTVKVTGLSGSTVTAVTPGRIERFLI